MTGVMQSVGKAIASLGSRRILWLMLWPLLAAAIGWAIVAGLVAPGLVDRLAAWAASGSLPAWIPAAAITGVVGWLLVIVAYLALVVVTTAVILGAFSMPFVVSHVADRDFPGLERKAGGTIAGSVWNGVVGLAILAALVVVTLPLWIVPVLWPFLIVGVFAVLNQRVFRYDALAEHASADEMRALFKRHRGGLLALGALTAAIGLVPVAGFFSPVIGGLAFAHYCLARLAELRGARNH